MINQKIIVLFNIIPGNNFSVIGVDKFKWKFRMKLFNNIFNLWIDNLYDILNIY